MYHRQIYEKMNKEGVLQVMDFIFHLLTAFPQFQLIKFGPITDQGYLQIHINWSSLQLIIGYNLSQELKFPELPNEQNYQEFMESIEFLVYIECPLCQKWFQSSKEDLVNFSNCEDCNSKAHEQFNNMFQGGVKSTLFDQGHVSHTGQHGANIGVQNTFSQEQMKQFYNNIPADQQNPHQQVVTPNLQNLQQGNQDGKQ